MDNFRPKPVSDAELIGHNSSGEGDIELIYGRIGNGKTTESVRRIISTLANGGVVYSNIMLDLSSFSFDDRTKLSRIFFNLFFWRRRFYSYSKENYYYFDPDDTSRFPTTASLIEFLSSRTDCEIYYDEGQWLFDSYQGTTFSVSKRKLINSTRHFNRKLVIISQRFNAIQVTARGNVNRFYKCVKLLSFPFLILRVIEYQDLVGEEPDETKPAGSITYFANKKYFRAFDTHYLRRGLKPSQKVKLQAWDYSFVSRLFLLKERFFRRWLKPAPTSLGVKFDWATLKRDERLNTVVPGEEENTLPF